MMYWQLAAIFLLGLACGGAFMYFRLTPKIREALHDPLTGLPGKRLGDKLYNRALMEFERRREENALLAVYMLDLDNFKPVNDTLGHDAGNKLLKQVAHRLKQVFKRKGDIVIRLGGDEFLVVAHVASIADAVALGSKAIDAISQPYIKLHGGQDVHYLSMSVGLALAPVKRFGSDMLKPMADAALYKAKEQGKNKLIVFDEAWFDVPIPEE